MLSYIFATVSEQPERIEGAGQKNKAQSQITTFLREAELPVKLFRRGLSPQYQ